MDEDAPPPTVIHPGNDGAPHRDRPIISGHQLDVEAYSNLYSGRTKINRLVFIAEKCGVPSMELEALRIAYDEVKKGSDTELFRKVVEKIGGRLGDAYGPDAPWANAVEKRAEIKMKKLESDIESYRANMIKESIRMGYCSFADFLYEHGNLVESFKNYVRTRDYCTTSKHVVQMCVSAILVSIEMGQYTHVRSYVSKAEENKDVLDPLTAEKLRCSAALAMMQCKHYRQAAQKFLEMGIGLGNKYNEVIAPQDIATYGGLCALASFDRADLKRKVIDNYSFRNFLELVPEMRELINDFYYSRYASCHEYLQGLKPNLLLDIHLHTHLETLYDQIRCKALIQYTLPFSSIDLNTMASAFKTTAPSLEKELETLIMKKQIQAKIDSHNKVLYARHADQRNGTFQRVLQNGEKFDRDLRAMLLRARVIMHEPET